MRTVCQISLLFLSWVFLTAMGGVGDSGLISVPVPPVNFSATITDRSDLSTVLERFSIEGKTAISGRLGSGRISIGFDKIASIAFVLQDEGLRADVALKEGDEVVVWVDKGMACYGKLPYGDMQIAVAEIRAVTIHGEVVEKAVGGN
ncbi:MAG: hypothetical protein SWE60_18980 [Thermodesulfobacteriota bacterium]|nr:hypothetical protein [Thermodesulfobacteriota bacterium]